MKNAKGLVAMSVISISVFMAGCAPEEIGDTVSPYRPYIKINNNTKYSITKIKGFMGQWGVIGTTWDWHLFPLIDAGESKYVSLQQYYPDFENNKFIPPLEVYANGRWSTTVLLGPDGNIYNSWEGPKDSSRSLYRRGMTLYLVDGNNGDLYLTNVPVK